MWLVYHLLCHGAEIDYRNVKIDFDAVAAGVGSGMSRLRARNTTASTVLVTGAAGYIGSTMSLLLLERKFDVIAIDDLSRGALANIETLQKHGLQWFYRFDLSDTQAVQKVLRRHAVHVVIHFAANAFASESVARPLLYFHNVTQNTLSVLEAMASAGVSRLIYSSSCATYGEPGPEDVPVTETTQQRPVSPYGVSKKISEDIILSTAASYAKTGGGLLQAGSASAPHCCGDYWSAGAYCLLLTAYCLLLTAHCSLLATPTLDFFPPA